MVEKIFLIKFKPPSLAIHQVIATTVGIHDEHLIFCDSQGKLAALFLLEVVQSWTRFKADPEIRFTASSPRSHTWLIAR